MNSEGISGAMFYMKYQDGDAVKCKYNDLTKTLDKPAVAGNEFVK